MSFDHTYAEFGYDSDTIRAVMIKHKVYYDKEFEELITSIHELRLDTLLNNN